MRNSVTALEAFYASPLGAVGARLVLRKLRALWPEANGLDVLGFGYATPFLEPYRAGARRAIAIMPSGQGARRWPGEGAGACLLSDERRLPFIDALFDRVILAHALEEADNAQQLLREVWRVSAPEARIVVVVANRVGLWARRDAIPFGHGRPFSRGQLAALLSGAMFEPTASARAAFAPPVGWPPLLACADALEALGERLAPAFGGILMMEAVKRLAAAPAKPVAARALGARAPANRRVPLAETAV